MSPQKVMEEVFIVPLDRPTDSMGITMVPELSTLSLPALKHSLKKWAKSVAGADASLMLLREGDTYSVCSVEHHAIQWKIADSLEQSRVIINDLREYFVATEQIQLLIIFD